MSEKEKTEAAVENALQTSDADVLDGTVEDGDYIIKFKDPYRFEDKTYTEIDLSEVENLTANDMNKVSRVLERSGFSSLMGEMTLEYACYIAAAATKTPVEFFKQLRPRDAMKVKLKVISIFFGED